MRKVHEIVCNECRQAQSEYKRLRTVVDQLAREYDQSKDLDFVRRYTALKVRCNCDVLALGKVSISSHSKAASFSPLEIAHIATLQPSNAVGCGLWLAGVLGIVTPTRNYNSYSN